MASPVVQLSFTLRTSPNVRTVHLLGSWDNYKNQLPLSSLSPSSDNPSVKPGSWRGTFRFQGSHALKLGSRYWYYYIVDGYHVSHDPAKEFVTEPTTGRMLNILDVPGPTSGATSAAGVGARGNAVRPSVAVQTSPTNARHSTTSTSGSVRHSRELPQGRALSPGKILHPKPSKPYASRTIREADYETSPVEGVDDLIEDLASVNLAGYTGRHGLSSGASSSPSSSLSGSSGSYSAGADSYGSSPHSDSPSSFSSLSSGSCRCERFGITRSGERVKMDCGGARCGYISSSTSSGSECSSDTSSDSEREGRQILARKELERIRERERAKELEKEKDSRRGKEERGGTRDKDKDKDKAKSRHAAPTTDTRRGHVTTSGGGRRR